MAKKQFLSNVAMASACSSARVFMTNVTTITVFTIDLVQDSSGSLFLDLVFSLFKCVGNGANRLMNDFDVEISEDVCDSLGEPFGVEHDNQAALMGLIHFLLSVQLAAIMN